jgi:Ca2+-binding EF-hand superfamily protein
MMIKKLTLATLVALGMSAAAIAQQPSQQPGQRSAQPPSSSQQQPSQQPAERSTQPQSSQSTPAPRGGDRTEQVTFERADKNGDGRVNREEGNDIDGFDFSRADTNNDASLTRQEFQAAMTTSTPREGPGARNDAGSARSGDASPSTSSGQGQRTAAMSFDTADKDKDGKVTRAEAADVQGLNFSSADTDGDASLSRQEFQVAMAGAQPRG